MKAGVSVTVTGAAVEATNYKVALSVVSPAAAMALGSDPVAAVTHAELMAAASAAVPVTEIAYIELAIGAEINETGLFRFVSEVALIVDDLDWVLSKALSDLSALADAASLLTQRPVLDQFGVADALASITASKLLADLAAISELVARITSKKLLDSFGASDARATTLHRPVSEVVGVNDARPLLGAIKSLSDSAQLSDEVLTLLTYLRTFADQALPSDLFTSLFVRAPVADQVAVGDEFGKLLLKAVFDGVAIDDSASAGDGSTYSLSKFLSNVALVADAVAFLVSKQSADSTFTSDAGLALCQNYCDISYFAEDYVGVSQVF